MNDPKASTQGNWKCDVCDTQFTGESYYRTHLRTKKHKRNLKSARGAVYERGFSGQFVESLSLENNSGPPIDAKGAANQTPPQLSDLTDLHDYNGERETYHQKKTRLLEDYYTSYVSSTVAYWAVNLSLNPTVHDFKITINDKTWNDFGDAVVEIEFKNLPGTVASIFTFVVHFKHIASNNVKTWDSFKDGRFSFEGFVRQIGKIKGKTQQEMENARFFIFTTSAPDPKLDTALTVRCCEGCCNAEAVCKCSSTTEKHCECQEQIVYARTLSNRRNLLLNTSEDNESIYRFYPKVHSYNLPKIYVYSCQKKLRNFPEAIEEMIFDSFNEKRIHVARDFIKYIENWGRGLCGGVYKLKKEEVLVKLGQLLLSPLRVTPRTKTIEGPANKFAIWIQSIKSTDVTILKPSTDLPKLLEPFNLLIEKELALKIDTITNTVTIVRTKKQDDTRHMQNSILRAYLFEETMRDFASPIPLEKVYSAFWKAGLMPLILQLENKPDQNYALHVISVLKSYGLSRRYLVKTTDDSLQTIDVKALKPLSFFVNLDDISDKLGMSLLELIRIRVTDHFYINLAAIEQPGAFFKAISADELFDLILGKYVFKSYNFDAGQEENGNIKLVLNNDLIIRFRQEIKSRNDLNRVLISERTRNEMFSKQWLHGVNPNLFCKS